MKDKLFSKGKPIPPFMLFLFTVVCLFTGFITILFDLPETLLFLLAGGILFSFLYYPGWVVYTMLGIWMGVIIWVNSQLATDFPQSFLTIGIASASVAGMLLVIYQVYVRQQAAYLDLKGRFRVMAEYSPAFEYWEYPDGTISYISPSCESFSGYTPDQFMQNQHLRVEIILPEDREKLAEFATQHGHKPQGIQQAEIHIQHKSGQIRWVKCQSRQVFDEDGQHIGRRISFYDINDLMKELEDYKIEFERLFSAFDSTDDGVWDLNLVKGEILFFDKYSTKLGFKTGEQIKLKEYYALVHPDDLPGLLNAFKDHLTWKSPTYAHEYRLLSRFGKWRWVLDRGKILTQDKDGKPTRMVGTHIDITERKVIEDALQQSEEKFRQLAENMREVFWLRERDNGRFIYISPAFAEVWGRPAKQMYDDPNVFVESIYWEDFGRVFHGLRELVAHGIIFNEEYRVEHMDGSIHWVWARAYPIYDSKKNYYRIAGIAEDITERKEGEVALRESEKRYRDLIERQGGGVSIIDPNQKIIYMNPAGEDVFGVPRGSISGRSLQDFMDNEQFSFISKQSNLRQQGAESSFEISIHRPDNDERNLLITTTPRFDVNSQFLGSIAIFKDITQRKEQEDKLRYIGLHDTLTGLFNRTFFEDEIQRLEANGIYPVGIIIVDADGLKSVNDQLGHAMGDDFLIRAAKVLKKSVRGDDVVARIGGDEFAILMPHCDENILHQVLNRLETNIVNENDVNELNYILSLSAGGYTCNLRGTLRESIEKADARMYEIKNKKKKRLFFTLPIKKTND
jgi:diguanylate cyclase (GGDEF)-like protein/PAS domain S-box-containing protein